MGPLVFMSRTKVCPTDVIVEDQRTNLFLLGTKLSDPEIVKDLVGGLLYIREILQVLSYSNMRYNQKDPYQFSLLAIYTTITHQLTFLPFPI